MASHEVAATFISLQLLPPAIIVLGFFLGVILCLIKQRKRTVFIAKEAKWSHCLSLFLEIVEEGLRGENVRLYPASGDSMLGEGYLQRAYKIVRSTRTEDDRNWRYWKRLDPKARESELDARRKVLELSDKLFQDVATHRERLAELAQEIKVEQAKIGA